MERVHFCFGCNSYFFIFFGVPVYGELSRGKDVVMHSCVHELLLVTGLWRKTKLLIKEMEHGVFVKRRQMCCNLVMRLFTP